MGKLCLVETIYDDGGGAKIRYGDKFFDIPVELLPKIAEEGTIIEIFIQIDHSKTVVKRRNHGMPRLPE